jgi:hypothetical protein
MSDFRMDEAGLFLERQLEFIRPQVFEVTYADIKYPTLLPVTSEAGPGAQTFTYRIMDSTGEFKLIADAADDLPRADISQVGEEHQHPFVRRQLWLHRAGTACRSNGKHCS